MFLTCHTLIGPNDSVCRLPLKFFEAGAVSLEMPLPPSAFCGPSVDTPPPLPTPDMKWAHCLRRQCG